MFTWVAKKLFGTSNERTLKRLRPKVEAINALEKTLAKLSDAELQAKTPEFKRKLDAGATLDDLLVEAFAVCREAGKRSLKMRHYDVQLIGGMVLHSGAIAEMRTGEGKTLVATLPIYLNALAGKGVHLVTVNDYLAKRDAEWMGRLYNFLGLSIGTIVNQQSEAEKIAAYKCDICYGQNNEFGFDYLRDNMKFSALQYAQRELAFAIVDEVDSILIDEARTPLIISGPADAASAKYRTLNEVVSALRKDEHYTVDEKGFSVTFTDEGIDYVQEAVGIDNLYEPVHVQTLHILNQLLRAHALYKRDQHYLVTQDGQVVIVDEFTGRVLRGRRWSDGLHQAVEAKENVRIQEESRTMATITFQNLFRQYGKLAGMTGTAETEAAEFMSTYKLDVVAIPTNKENVRQDSQDIVYKTEKEKFTAVIDEILRENEKGRPILVGTTSVEKSAAVSKMLKKRKIPHEVLNAKHHENEAFIVAQAGRKGAITVSTNMAGRGTDILLGGNPEMLARWEIKEQGGVYRGEADADYRALVAKYEAQCAEEHEDVVELGGLHIVGTERHESRRIDNQLRGRAGRQGDPGSSQFYLSLEDDLMRIFAGDRVKNLMDRMGMPDDEPIEHPWVTKSIENAQRKVEERNFDVRKNLLEYDDVMNAQRKTVYSLRQALLVGRYTPEELDELGKPTGEPREVAVAEDIRDAVEPLVSQLVYLFADNPEALTDEQFRPRKPRRGDFEGVSALVDLESLRHEAYQAWGVKLDLAERRERTPVELHDELVALVLRGLSEQRERLLDLCDKVASAIVEESCPANKQPEDWDYAGIRAAFRETFRVPLQAPIEELGDAERIVRDVYAEADAAYRAREEALGIDQALRVFRFEYLQALDQAWVDHLSNMEHLRDGIGLRGYGQRDPKNEYKKESYDLFVNMMAKVSASTLEQLFAFGANDIESLEAEAEEQARLLLEQAVARHPAEPELAELEDESQVRAHVVDEAEVLAAARREPVRAEPKVGRNDVCPCGSGKKFKKCHGAALEDDSSEDESSEDEQRAS
ncbi:MAG: preprotein translocase subunit SecA [Polyangiaceae bacterium]|nr:preprotein translocase subunit SecA [Polyangiaceae bacterium]